MMWLITTATVGFIALIGYNVGVRRAMRKEPPLMHPARGIFHEVSISDHAVLFLHGYIGTPADLGRLPELLHDRGYTVEAPVLPGHGTSPEDFSKISVKEMVGNVLAHYDRLRSRYRTVSVVGISMGGALATILATQREVDRLVLLAPYFKVRQRWFYGLPVEWYPRLFGGLIPFVYRDGLFQQLNDRSQRRNVPAYRYLSMRGTQTAMRLADMAREAFDAVKAPVLIIHSINDEAVEYKAVAERLRPSDRLVTLQRSNHLICWDYEREEVEAQVVGFLSEFQPVVN